MLALLLALLSALALVALGDLRLAAPAAVGVLLAWGLGVLALPRPKWRRPIAVAAGAAAVRLVLLWSPATLSDDLYRYLWEGGVVWRGGNPYLYAPSHPQWADFAADPILLQVNHGDVSSVYPPTSLLVFGALAAVHYGPLSIKLFMGLCDVVTVWALGRVLQARGRSMDGAWLYALMPLAAVETAGSGHLEGLAIMCAVLAVLSWDLGRSGIGWAGLGGLIKLLPGALLPSLWRRSPWLFGLLTFVTLISALPFVEAGPALVRGLSTYVEHWSFNASLFSGVEAIFGSVARPIAVALGVVVALVATLRHRDPVRVWLWVGAAFVLLSPTVHPWYVLWAWVPALVVGVRAWTVLAALAPIAYIALASIDPATGQWHEQWWPRLLQYGPFFVAVFWEASRRLVRPGPWAPERA
jgi:hypothetical protein